MPLSMLVDSLALSSQSQRKWLPFCDEYEGSINRVRIGDKEAFILVLLLSCFENKIFREVSFY